MRIASPCQQTGPNARRGGTLHCVTPLWLNVQSSHMLPEVHGHALPGEPFPIKEKAVKGYFTKASMRFELRDVDLSPMAPDEVLVRVRPCGVCGRNVLVAQDWSPIGHELSAEIVAVGSAVPKLHVGDPFVVENSTFCGPVATLSSTGSFWGDGHTR
jgi:hypothetical protein